MRLLLILALLIPATSFAEPSDLENPSTPSDYRSGFFGMDARGLSDQAWSDWGDPGNDYCRVKFGHNCDGSDATAQQVSGAVATWSAMNQCNRWRLRLFHDAEIKKVHDTIGEKVAVLYSTNIPADRKDQIKACLDPGTFEYLGDTFAAVCAKLNQRSAGLCAHFWPAHGHFAAEQPDHVISGWESDFGL